MPHLEDKGRLSPQTATICDALQCRMRTEIGLDGGPGCRVAVMRANGRTLKVIREDFPGRIPLDCPQDYGR